MADDDYMTSDEVVEALHIKPSTLYAYVSRGVLRRLRDPGRRRSMYLREDVERLTQRHPGQVTREDAAASALRWGAPLLTTSIGYITDEGPVYRNQKASDLAQAGMSFEAVAHLLLTGVWQPGIEAWPEFDFPDDLRKRLKWELEEVVPDDVSKVFASVVLALGMKGRGQKELLSGSSDTARLVLHTLAGCFGALTVEKRFIERHGDESVSEHILRAAGCQPAVHARSSLNQMLILLADHEMAAASFVSRITASTNGDLFCCVAAALCAHAGSSMVAAALEVERRLFGPLSRENWGDMLELARKRGASLFGFNHPLYPHGDPRAEYLLDLAGATPCADPKVPLVLELLEDARREYGLLPGIAIALAVFSRSLCMPFGSAAALWNLSRTVGWIAHAFEQRTQAFMLRPRARYVSSIGSDVAGNADHKPSRPADSR